MSLPRDLRPVTVIVVGFSRASSDATTAWEIAVRKQMVTDSVGLYDVAVLASVPRLLQGWVTRAIRDKVPQMLQQYFLPVYKDEGAWRSFCGYDEKAPDAAYVVLVDREGRALWRTHQAYSAEVLHSLAAQTHLLAK